MVMTLDSDVSNLLGEYVKEEADLVRKEFCSRHPQSPQSLHPALVPTWNACRTSQSNWNAVGLHICISLLDALLQSCFDTLQIFPFFQPDLSLWLVSVWEHQLFSCEGQGQFVMAGVVPTEMEEGREELYNSANKWRYLTLLKRQFENETNLLGKSWPFGYSRLPSSSPTNACLCSEREGAQV